MPSCTLSLTRQETIMDSRRIGYAELYTRMLRVLQEEDPDTQLLYDDQHLAPPWYVDGEPYTINAFVLAGLGVTAEAFDKVYRDGDPPHVVFPSVGIPLTASAEALAESVWLLECRGISWADAVRSARREPGAVHYPPAPEDRQLGECGLLALLRHAAKAHPDSVSATPLRLYANGSPASLMGHVIAELGVPEEWVTFHDTQRAAILLPALGWMLSDRARFAAISVQSAELKGMAWAEIVFWFEDHLPQVLDHQPCDI
ncbi:hypothetical protein ACFYOT_25330 [Saccharothrix saharensis]|uniref:hypothetical protein n=1 Tax=Saccharothrix saharensis TaxID=571190 RepID=UPI0036CDA1CA